ncbi:MAG: tetratricopeptide repeat protein, partial [Tepidisphaeraceae bacterium]
LMPLADRPQPRPEVFLLLASIADAAGDGATAESHYRRALKVSPDTPAALNNLAYLLLTRGDGNLSEAQTMAARAVALAPTNPSFHDTLARVQLQAGDAPAARKSFDRAIDLDPSNVEAMIGKATALSGTGDRDELRTLLQQIDAALSHGKPTLSEALKRELEAARSNANAAVDPR